MMISRLITLTLLALSLASAVMAETPSGLGLRGVKSALNTVTFASAQLDRTDASKDIQKMEAANVAERGIHVGQITAVDAVIDSIEMNQDSLYVKIEF